MISFVEAIRRVLRVKSVADLPASADSAILREAILDLTAAVVLLEERLERIEKIFAEPE
jgi:hypothetical protein